MCGGDVRRRGEVSLLVEDDERGGHARRVMESYEKWLGEGPEVSILRLIGLFDRPADPGCVSALREPPVIPGLTGFLAGLPDAGWRQALARLRKARLLAEPDPHDPDTLDAHPLVREHFGRKLKEKHPDAWREGHNRLYEHLKDVPRKELPDTLEEMAPLFAAVAHGCAAGRHQDALDEVFRPRIQRRSKHFSGKMLGARGADLAALSAFFDSPWSRPAPALLDHDKAFLLSAAGFGLQALGRLGEAAEPMRAGLDAHIAQEDWENAAISASNLSELHLAMGEVGRALEYARQAVDLAGPSGNVFQRVTRRVRLADTLHQAGRAEKADALFREAEGMQKERQPKYPLLYSLSGFQYCDLLLEQGKFEEVIDRAKQTIEIAEINNWLLDIALDHLSLGRAHLHLARQEGMGGFSLAAEHLDRAVEGLRRAGQQDDLPRGLLARAELHRLRNDYGRAKQDLEEAMEIAERGGMGLHRADANLEYARLCLAMGEKDKARAHLGTAKKQIERMGYGRREKEVQELEARLK